MYQDSNGRSSEWARSGTMTQLQQFLQKKIIDCETLFADASTTPDMIFLKGMLEHGGQTNALLMNIGKRQAYMEILEYTRRNHYE